MDIEMLRAFFGWCSLLNLLVLLVWLFCLTVTREAVTRTFSRWFDVSEERLNFAHYCLLGVYEILFLVFCVMPYLSLRIIGVLHY